jgi:hypothetical protein
MEVGYTGTRLDRLHLPEEEKPGQLDWSMRISTGRSRLRLMTGRLWWQLRIITKGHGDKGFSDGLVCGESQSWTRRGRECRQSIPIQGSRCFVFSGGRRASGAHLPSARCRLHDRQKSSNGRFVSLTTQTVPDPGWFAQEPEAAGVTSVQRSARWLSSTASRILSWRSPSTNCGYSGAEVDVRIEA